MGGEREEGAVQSVVLVRAEGGRSSQQQGGGCEGWACVHCFGVRGLMGMEAWEREDGGAGGGGGKEGGCGAGVMGGDDGALVTTYVHTDGGAAGGGGWCAGWTDAAVRCLL